MKQTNFPGRKQKRQAEAVARAAERAKRGDAGQLARLATLFPNGAVREKARLSK